MSNSVNPLAPHTLPWFITAPGATDGLYIVTTIVVIAATVLLGVFFFWLHSLPERMGHRKLQFEVVSVLALISLFTHMHIFWIIGLLLALVDLPDAARTKTYVGYSDAGFLLEYEPRVVHYEVAGRSPG